MYLSQIKFGIIFMGLLLIPIAMFSQVGIGTTSIDNGVMLQIDSPDKGVLIPRIALTSTTDNTTIPGTLTNGTLIYNITDNASLDEGFYFWQTDRWVAVTPVSTDNIYNTDGTLNGDRMINAGGNLFQIQGAAGRNALTITRTDNEINQGIAFRNSGNYYDASIFMEKESTANPGLVFASGGNYGDPNSIKSTLTLKDDRSIVFNDYGTGKYSGTLTNLLGVDSNGNVIETQKATAEANIYNSNGTFTGDRIINTNDHTLTFRNSAGRDFNIVPANPGNINDPFIFSTLNSFNFQVDSYNTLTLEHDGHIRFGTYGQGTHTGTATYQMGVDASGNVIEVPLPQNNTGIQYYSYNLSTFTSPPNIATIKITEKADAFGRYSGTLSSANGALTAMKPSQSDYYVIKITGNYFVQSAGTFNFSSTSDDGARIYIDGSLVLDAWTTGTTKSGSGSANLAKGKHRFEFWYYELNQSSDFTFSWGTNPDGRSGLINTGLFTID